MMATETQDSNIDHLSTNSRVRTCFFELGDVVRGSVQANGSAGMTSVVEKLKTLSPRFEVWRIKNTHHVSAETVGGYRDVKVLGRFTSGDDNIAMIVEIQVIDKVFLDVKKYMHKAYAVQRGDFWRN